MREGAPQPSGIEIFYIATEDSRGITEHPVLRPELPEELEEPLPPAPVLLVMHGQYPSPAKAKFTRRLNLANTASQLAKTLLEMYWLIRNQKL